MSTAAKVVRYIPAKETVAYTSSETEQAKKRVAAYARVSTDTEEQRSSYDAQVDYYTRYIQENENWIYVCVYTDEGITATNTKRRDGFKRMVKDALDGKIDLIITKSVSRFARNTVDTLTTVRQLKEKGVEVYFERENIYTLDSKGELLITIMSSLAQEESRSISENVTWGQRKRFADGKVSMPYKRFLGYTKGENGQPAIVEEEAETVRMIYRMFLQGKAPNTIATQLTDNRIPTPSGKEIWRANTVESILTNEKYKGDALLQKCYTVDFLTKKQKVNQGEVPQYYVENSHPAIIAPEVFDLVQYEIKQRKASGRFTSAAHFFSGKIICGNCGGIYGSKTWHSNSKYRRVVWQCNDKHSGGEVCRTAHLTDDTIKTAFVTVANRLIGNRAVIRQAYNEMLHILTDNAALESERADLENECDIILGILQKQIDENANRTLDQEEYQRRHNAQNERFAATRDRLQEVENLIIERSAKRAAMERFMKSLDAQAGLLTEFDEDLWYALVDKLTVISAYDVRFTFRDGSEDIVSV